MLCVNNISKLFRYLSSFAVKIDKNIFHLQGNVVTNDKFRNDCKKINSHWNFKKKESEKKSFFQQTRI